MLIAVLVCPVAFKHAINGYRRSVAGHRSTTSSDNVVSERREFAGGG